MKLISTLLIILIFNHSLRAEQREIFVGSCFMKQDNYCTDNILIDADQKKINSWKEIVKNYCQQAHGLYKKTRCPDKNKVWACVSDNKKERELTWQYSTTSKRDLKFRKMGCQSIQHFKVKKASK